MRRFRSAQDPGDRERLVEVQFPELAIVDRALWNRVQARLAEHEAQFKRRELSDRKSAYLLSGLLRCGTCGALMQIAGGTIPRYRCSANAKRGSCSNRLSVRERELREAVVAGLAENLSAPATLTFLEQQCEAFLRQRAGAKN